MGGDFTQSGLATIYDPTTQTIVTSGNCTYTGAEFPGGTYSTPAPCVQRKSFTEEYGSGNKIPTGMISPAAQAIQKAELAAAGYPSSVPSYSVNNFSLLGPSGRTILLSSGLDAGTPICRPTTGSPVSETESDNPEKYLNHFCPFYCQNGDVSRDNGEISDVWTISPHLINEARMGFTDQLNFFTP